MPERQGQTPDPDRREGMIQLFWGLMAIEVDGYVSTYIDLLDIYILQGSYKASRMVLGARFCMGCLRVINYVHVCIRA